MQSTLLGFSSPGWLSSEQLRTMHRNLGLPTVEKQMQVLENARIGQLSGKVRNKFKEIVDYCKPYQLLRAKPRRLLFSMKDDTTDEFNHTLQVDAGHFSDGNVLHVICTGTGFQRGLFIAKTSAATAWKVLKRCWINIFAGAPDYIIADAGSNFTAEEMKASASSMGIIIKSVPTETLNRIGKVERSHSVLRAIYEKLKINLPNMQRDDRLSMSFLAINHTPNSTSGISSTMFVFGVLPKLAGVGRRRSMAEKGKLYT